VTVPTGAAIASDALRYVGQGYTYGGPAGHPGDWDCSSFVSYVLGHDLSMTLPGGGTYGTPGNPPASHGPVVGSYATWSGATTLPKGASPAAGDLCVFVGVGPLGHIGIAVDATHMVSALNHVDGTRQSGIVGNGPAGAPLVYRRVNGAGQVPGTPAGSSGGGLASLLPEGVIAGLLVGAAIPVGVIVVVLGGALLVGSLGAVLVASAARRG
jgi:hypothetical protein